MTPSQFSWTCCQAGDYPPPKPKRGERYGPDAICWLCGGPTHGIGWPRKLGIADTFTDVANARCMPSETVCQSCVAMSQSNGWQKYVEAHPERGFSAYFPTKEGKRARQLNWLYRSHLFAWPDQHECPDRPRWREILLNPPQPPFMVVIAVSGKKQIIFKSTIAHDRMLFPAQMDDDAVIVTPDFERALTDFERLYHLGFSKDSILSGDYRPKALMDVGVHRWQSAEAPAKAWRSGNSGLWRLCHYVARRPEGWETPKRPPAKQPDQSQQPHKGALF